MRARDGLLALWVLLLPAGGGAPAVAQETEEEQLSGLSREMRLGVRYYEKGEDLQAMDRFMEVLTKGDPAERAMANDYINRITRRMNTGREPGQTPSKGKEPVITEERPSLPVRRAAPGPEIVVEGGVASVGAIAMPERAPAGLPPPPPRVVEESQTSLPGPNKALMRKEIKAKIRALVESGLQDLRQYEDIRILMLENGDPRAIAIPSPLLFQSGISFQREAGKILDALTRMVYALGSAQVVILPEGTAIGDAKVLDMRRTMGISSQFYSAGIAPARVKINLLNTQVDIPRAFVDFRGVVILFVYNQPLGLVVDSTLTDEAGPPISLGVHPPSLSPERGEGVVIEFSVQDPPTGLVSWKFQLLQPSQGEERDLAPLQEVVGGSPVFHQIYWNGRQNYFGPVLASGRYECVLTATDARNRQRTLHRWIQLTSSSVPLSRRAAAAAAPRLPGAPPAELGTQAPPPAESLVQEPARAAPAAGIEVAPRGGRALGEGPAARRPAKGRPRASGRPAPRGAKAAAAPAATGAARPTKPSSGHYTLYFTRNTHQMTPDAEKLLAQAAETTVFFPLENLKITGYAHATETQPAELAERRAQMVAGLLINKYQVEPKKIQVASTVTEDPSYKVQLDFVKGE